MPTTPPPLLGYNNNVRHRGRIFHIQTEDSGVHRPRVMTHLFGDGGRILKSLKREYNEHVGSDDMATAVRRIMKEQHKAMFIALRRGDLDKVIEEAFGPFPAPPPEKKAQATGDQAAPARKSSGSLAASSDPAKPAEPAAASGPPRRPSAGNAASASSTGLRARGPASATPPRSDSAPQVGTARSKPAMPAASVRRASSAPRSEPLSVPAAKAVAEARGENPVQVVAQQERTPSGRPVARGPGTPAQGVPEVRERRSDPSAGRYSVSRPSGETGGRYSVSRPSSIFGEAPPSARGESIFGDELIGEKSLDEVILSYLAEDLESPGQK